MKLLKKSLLALLLLLLALVAGYLILSSILIHPIDKSATIQAPRSDKSNHQIYAFGYQPELRYSEARQPCAVRVANKIALFGDLHIHTALSADAFPDGTRTFPADVYRFAQGEAIDIPTRAGQTQRRLQLRRPLDFAAVTDHAETFGEGYICRVQGAYAGYDSAACQTYRAGGEKGVREFMAQNAIAKPRRKPQVCGVNNQDCEQADQLVWQQVIEAAQAAYDTTSACRFTSFVGYEYTRSLNSHHLHRNAIFRNAQVPSRPANYFSHPNAYALLQSYEQECRLGMEHCDVISIPHNSNISAGNAFNPRETEGFSASAQAANRALRQRFDRLMEISQHKGTSECLNAVTDILGDVDELCNVEALRQFGKPEPALELNTLLPNYFGRSNSPECRDEHFDPTHNLYKGNCLSSRDFARGALLAGLEQDALHGVNPYEMGFIGSSDTHIGTAGATNETTWQGHIAYETTLAGRLGEAALGRFNRLVSNPGGLAGVYAVENSRDALFQSMKRREAFATSGTRIQPRFFAGEFADNLCNQDDWLEQAYQRGTPMGSKLPARSTPFQFLLQAQADPLAQPLTDLQLIKGWIDADGQKHNTVINVANSLGATQLCAVFSDPDYDPRQASYYYLRVVEEASVRWSAAQCASLPKNQRPENCNNAQPTQIVEMAWTSPIWFDALPRNSLKVQAAH